MKKTILIGGGIVLLLLGGAAFLGGRLLSGEGHSPDRVILPAKELPQTPADVNGIFDHLKDKSIFVGIGNITGSKTVDLSGNGHVTLSHSGPVVEVVVTAQTKIYKDTTARQYSGRLPDQGQIQQVVELGTVDEISESGSTTLITVWGRKTGDRYIADILVYTP
jgi:hypothetical protein